MPVIRGTKVTRISRQVVECPNTCRDIHSALELVSNGAKLTAASFSELDVKLVFDLEEKT